MRIKKNLFNFFPNKLPCNWLAKSYDRVAVVVSVNNIIINGFRMRLKIFVVPKFVLKPDKNIK
ncbi:hypothetical protein BpHYR1_019736 [Brachionus plicatilis]|uniref:Uncharacterized protein n=1 Tax=Brachionus plicatilis TaxID=10195 RepID=A0A3M7PFD7_BRAPC|nr:hypothetical protein BpHYR1_019736 [Brachionus plicatilis]